MFAEARSHSLKDVRRIEAAVEPRVRRVVADRLGVFLHELDPEASLADELAVDSLDLLELAIAVEGEFGVSIAEHRLETVRTYGDLVRITVSLVAAAQDAPAAPDVAVIARVVTAGGTLERAQRLTPYAAEIIAEDAVAAGAGSHLEVSVREPAGPGVVERVRTLFARLVARGIAVHVSAEPAMRLPVRRPAA